MSNNCIYSYFSHTFLLEDLSTLNVFLLSPKWNCSLTWSLPNIVDPVHKILPSFFFVRESKLTVYDCSNK